MSLTSRARTPIQPLGKAKAEDQDACKRRSRRKPTTLPGLLMFANMRTTVPCTVMDMSGSGARIGLNAAAQHSFGDLEHLPNRVTLVLRADHLQVDCEIVWRRDGKLGLRFLGPPRPMPRPGRG